MRLFAIADPHLSSVHPKPMSVFGGNWSGHPAIFFDRWRETVLEDDVVIVAGDISWALKLEDALPDLLSIADLPGRKVILRGNHDYWWPSISKLRNALPFNMQALQNDSIVIGDTAICGTRGWTCPGNDDFTNEDEKIYARELERFKLALQSLKDKSYKKLVIALHYPPTNGVFAPSGFTDLIEQAKPDAVVYGHLHGVHPTRALSSWKETKLHFVACDAVEFRPQMLFEIEPLPLEAQTQRMR
jgi:uncharacterized protein